MADEDVEGFERLAHMGGSFFTLPFNMVGQGLDIYYSYGNIFI
jgi:hypothetical protein